MTKKNMGSIEKYYEEFVKGKSSEEILRTMGDVATPGSRVYEMMKESARIKAIKENNPKNKSIFEHPIFKIIAVLAAIATIISVFIIFV